MPFPVSVIVGIRAYPAYPELMAARIRYDTVKPVFEP